MLPVMPSFISNLFGGPNYSGRPARPAKGLVEEVPQPKKGFGSRLLDWLKKRSPSRPAPTQRDLQDQRPFELPKVPEGIVDLRETPAQPNPYADFLWDKGNHEDFLVSGEWLYVASSNVYRWKYDWDRLILTIEFLSGAYYEYHGVQYEVAKDFIATNSPGRFVWNRLRDKYPYFRVWELEPDKPLKRRPNVVREVLPSDRDYHAPAVRGR